MDNHFNTPAEVIDLSIKACENKTRLPLGKMILLGIMAGAFIAFGGATSSTAAHAVENVGVARALAGCIFPVGLMLIVFLGGELFTGNCLIIMDVFDKRVTWGGLFRDLFIVFFSNLIGALCVDLLIVYSGNLNYSGGLLGAYTIKVAVGKIAISPLQGITSGILCNILVCLAVLMATSARDIAGKVWAIFFPIAFVKCYCIYFFKNFQFFNFIQFSFKIMQIFYCARSQTVLNYIVVATSTKPLNFSSFKGSF